MKALGKLERAGYAFFLTGDGEIGYTYLGIDPPPDGAWVRPLLAEVQGRQAEVAAILAARQAGHKAGETFTNKTRCHVVFPAGRWRRLDDGRIEALLDYDDMRLMCAFRDEVLL